MIAAVLGSIILLWIGSNIFGLLRNYLVARKCNLPMVITPINTDNTIWRVISQPLKAHMEAVLPEIIYNHIRPCIYGWESKGTYWYHQRVGKTFLLVNPNDIECWTADPVVAQSILARWKNDFPTMPMTRQILDCMGKNLLTSDGDVWSRQRRLIAPYLNERISSIAWTESGRQTRSMMAHLLKQQDGVSTDVFSGIKAVALNILSLVGYGQKQEWSTDGMHNDSSMDDPKISGRAAVFSAINVVVRNIVFASLIPAKTLQMSFMPKFMQRLGRAKEMYPSFAKQMLDTERDLPGDATRQNMASMLAQLSPKAGDMGHGEPKVTSQYLTPSEINGNLFVFTAAGFETTANAMGFAVIFLAAQPKWQNWLQEEIDEVFSDSKSEDLGEYNDKFPQLQRCLALLLETLRMVPPLLHTARSTDSPQAVQTSAHSGQSTIPGKSKVYINNVALQCDPVIWGADSTEFRPTRWTEAGKDVKTSLADMTRKGYMPWSGGPRMCPGAKMAQVEFTAVMASLFGKMHVEPVPLDGESMADAQQRLLKGVKDSLPVLTMEFRDASKTKLRWTSR